MSSESLDVDILIVGGGPAGLSAALRLAQLQRTHGGEPLSVAVLEKSREPGAHLLSGAVLDPIALRELVPDFAARGAPLETAVKSDRVYLLTARGKLPIPFTPPPLRNHGNFIVSLNRFGKWLAGLVEESGVDIFYGFPAASVLMDGDRVIGVRTGDRGVGRNGERRTTFEEGVDVRARVTIFADGVRGNLTKQVLRRLPLATGRQPEVFALGVKELWEIPAGRLPAGSVIHTLGHPLPLDEFGGGFIYGLTDTQASVGLVVGLDYKDPRFDPHLAFQMFKTHRFVSDLLRGGQMLRYGSKALPEGGWLTVPRPYMDGGLIAGDAGSFLNSFRLKGIHLAMKTGMLAAEAAFDAVRAGDTSKERLQTYERRIDGSYVRGELYPVRNVHQSFSYGLVPGLLYSAFALATRGWWFRDLPARAGHERMHMLTPDEAGAAAAAAMSAQQTVKPDRRLTFDRLTNVHFSGTRHEEDQPSHLLVHTEVCHTICGEEYGHPCTRFCPAQVYEIVPEGSGRRLQINASNCVHCKTCDIMDPYQVITWVPPEGGGGPQYDGM
jgi:electron-transferring-flavoprotein dehydrogenase